MRRILAVTGAAVLVAIATFAMVAPTTTVGAEPLVADVKPDAVLKAGDEWIHKSTDLQVEDPVLTASPTGCREVPDSATCDVYRIKFKRDPNPDALNFAYFTLDYKPVATVPDLALVAAGLKSLAVGQLNVRIFDQEDHYLGQNYPGQSDISYVLRLLEQTPLAPVMPIVRPPAEEIDTLVYGGGDGDPNDTPPGGGGPGEIPARGGWLVKQDVYDVKVYLSSLIPGINTEYTLRINFTNSKYDKPFELLDPLKNAEPTDGFTAPDFSGGVYPSEGQGQGSSSNDLSSLDLTPDADIAGIGLGVNEQFTGPPAAALGQSRRLSATAKAPSALAVVAGLVGLPGLFGLVGVLVVRRRRRSFAI